MECNFLLWVCVFPSSQLNIVFQMYKRLSGGYHHCPVSTKTIKLSCKLRLRALCLVGDETSSFGNNNAILMQYAIKNVIRLTKAFKKKIFPRLFCKADKLAS